MRRVELQIRKVPDIVTSRGRMARLAFARGWQPEHRYGPDGTGRKTGPTPSLIQWPWSPNGGRALQSDDLAIRRSGAGTKSG
jgi:hypothetical protein